MKLTIKEIKGSEPETKLEMERATNYLQELLFRPLSRYLVWLFTRMGFTANQVSGLGFLLAIAACVFLGIGTYGWVIAGALVLFPQFLLDLVDGGLARATGTVSRRGYYIDAMVGHFASLATPIFIGLGLWVSSGQAIFLILGFILSTLKAFRMLTAAEFVVAYSSWSRDTIKPTRKNLWWLIYTAGTNLVSTWRFFLLAFAVLGRVDWFIELFIVVTFFELIMALGLILVKPFKEVVNESKG